MNLKLMHQRTHTHTRERAYACVRNVMTLVIRPTLIRWAQTMWIGRPCVSTRSKVRDKWYYTFRTIHRKFCGEKFNRTRAIFIVSRRYVARITTRISREPARHVKGGHQAVGYHRVRRAKSETASSLWKPWRTASTVGCLEVLYGPNDRSVGALKIVTQT